jgi:UDPglucose--hexose-1-phosphate uridylyltransferase
VLVSSGVERPTPALSEVALDRPHRRFNPLTGEWLLVSPQRTQRPWQGQVELAEPTTRPMHDPGCYLCPGAARADGRRNPAYDSVHVFTNDFPALLPDTASVDASTGPFTRAQLHAGTCRVICYSPRHDLTLARMSVTEVAAVVDAWIAQLVELGRTWRWVQVFENNGALMGCSNAHPHGQIWAGDFVPTEPARELACQQRWLDAHGTVLLVEYARFEAADGERVVVENRDWLAVVPWWAVWPFETLVLPRRHVQRLSELTLAERHSLAELLGLLLRRYDGLFNTSFPYSFGWHGVPEHGADVPAPHAQGAQLHAHFYPPLLRSATVRKFMVGYEMLAEAQRDLTAEQAAARLRG